jgi:hypothetical protein
VKPMLQWIHVTMENPISTSLRRIEADRLRLAPQVNAHVSVS